MSFPLARTVLFSTLLLLTACGGGGGSAPAPTPTPTPTPAPTITSFSPTTLGSGTVVTITGTHLMSVTQVQFNGVQAASFTVTSDTQIQATAPAAPTAGVITVTTSAGSGSSSAYTIAAPSPQAQVLLNTGFESSAPMAWQGDTGVIQTAATAGVTGVVAHGGTYFAFLGGYGYVASDQIYQDLYVPASATTATVTFYLKILTAETGTKATDSLTVAALSTSNAVLGTLLTKSNLDAADYTAYSVSLLPYKGQVVRLSFKTTEDAQLATSFVLDDVTANILVPSAADLKPLVTSFTPTSGLPTEQIVQISGGNFFGVANVQIGGVSASFTLLDDTRLSATVPAGAAFGAAPINLTNAQGTGSSAATFSVVYGTPTVTAMNPTQGPVGTPVVLSGTYLGYAGTTVTLNGTAIPTFTQSATQISFVIPTGATTGSLVVSSPGGSATPRTFTLNTAASTLDLHPDRVQLTQSTQTLDNAVPLVAGKPGLIRVFVLANQTNSATPSVRVTLKNNGVAVSGYPKTILATRTSVPTVLDESTLSSSWNLVVPGTDLTTPTGTGYTLLAEVDPTATVSEADKTNNTLSSSLAVTTVPTFKTTIFPVVLSSGTGDASAANQATWVARLAKMYPVATVDVQVGATFTGSVSTLSSDGTGWNTLLSDLAVKHTADAATDRYYYGALNVSYSSGVAGLGYVPTSSADNFRYRTAIGWDKTGYTDGGNFPEVFAHETGHNMGRAHSPCGVSDTPDPNYPYAGASIGVFGYDSILGSVYTPTGYKDIMSYCHPNWVSDYVYRKILEFRNGTGGFLAVGPEDAPLKVASSRKESLIVRGIVHQDGTVELLPSFRTLAQPTAQPGSGEYSLRCLDAAGATLFSTALELVEAGCLPNQQERHFLVALPLEASVLDAIAGLDILQVGKVTTQVRSTGATASLVVGQPEARRLDANHVHFVWDASAHPAVLVRDSNSGEVIAILAGGSRVIQTTSQRFDLVMSDGVRGPTHHLQTPD